MKTRRDDGPNRAKGWRRVIVLLLLVWAAGTGVGGAGSTSTTSRTKAVPHPRAAADVPTTGTCHTVRRGQTLYAISRLYGVPAENIVRVNALADPSSIDAGRILFIPGVTGGPKNPPPPRPRFAWPIRGAVTSGFGSNGKREHHEGIDIDGVMGEVVRAAAAGRVIWAGTERGYGNMVIVDHGDGYSTVYAHASRLLVGADESVEAGEPIAEVGQSGNARGAHLHFEVRRDGSPVNPLALLGGSSRATVMSAASRPPGAKAGSTEKR